MALVNMKTTIERIQAGKLLPKDDLRKLGLAPLSVVRVVLETIDDADEFSVTEMNAEGLSFDYLTEEPDLYTDSDLIECNNNFVR